MGLGREVSAFAALPALPAPLELASLIGQGTTGVLLVTSSAILLATLSNKHAATGATLRALTSEWRNPATTAERRANIYLQIAVFERRGRFLWRASLLHYGALLCFLLVVVALMFTGQLAAIGRFAVLPLACGILLLAAGLGLQLLEVRLSAVTLKYEVDPELRAKPVDSRNG
jgi:hypothetical protein